MRPRPLRLPDCPVAPVAAGRDSPAPGEARAGGGAWWAVSGRDAVQEPANRGEVAVTFFGEGHVRGILEHDKLGVRQPPGHVCGGAGRAHPVVAPGQHQHRVPHRTEPVFDVDPPVVLRGKVADDLWRIPGQPGRRLGNVRYPAWPGGWAARRTGLARGGADLPAYRCPGRDGGA